MLLGIVGLMGSLFIRPRRTWVRVTRRDGRTVVEVAGLDRSSGGDLGDEIDDARARRAPRRADDSPSEETVVSTADFAAFSNNAIAFASIVYTLAFLAHITEWALAARPVVGLPPEPLAPQPRRSSASADGRVVRGRRHRRRDCRAADEAASTTRSSGSRSSAGSASR